VASGSSHWPSMRESGAPSQRMRAAPTVGARGVGVGGYAGGALVVASGSSHWPSMRESGAPSVMI
jgi:hypothetical protein